jgi:hypothetical protein
MNNEFTYILKWRSSVSLLFHPTSSRYRLERGRMNKAGYLKLSRYASDVVTPEV